MKLHSEFPDKIVAWYTQKAQRLRPSCKCRGKLKMTTDVTSVSCGLIFARALTCFFDNKKLRSKYNSASLPDAGNLVIYHTHTSLITYMSLITLFDLQLDAQNSYLFTYYIFVKILYMFRALPCSPSGGLRRNCIYAAFGIVTVCRWLSCAPVKKGLS
jgi:hypothetical protein